MLFSTFYFLRISPITFQGLRHPSAEILSKNQQIDFFEAIPAYGAHDFLSAGEKRKNTTEIYG